MTKHITYKELKSLFKSLTINTNSRWINFKKLGFCEKYNVPPIIAPYYKKLNQWISWDDLLSKTNIKQNMSDGENAVAIVLNYYGIKFYQEYSFKDSAIPNLRFDFYLPQAKILIEVDGVYHKNPEYILKKMGKTNIDEYKAKVKKNDLAKNEFALKANYNLIRITYSELNNIFIILKTNGIELDDSIPKPKLKKFFEFKSNTRIDINTVSELRRLYNYSGESMGSLSRNYSLSYDCVKDIINNKSYKDSKYFKTKFYEIKLPEKKYPTSNIIEYYSKILHELKSDLKRTNDFNKQYALKLKINDNTLIYSTHLYWIQHYKIHSFTIDYQVSNT